jgi:hypothetical protein
MRLNKSKLQQDFQRFCTEWSNTSQANKTIYDYFNSEVDNYDFLKKHCDVIAGANLGYGEKPFRYLWLLLFAQLENSGKFLEIGVYKGSILALSQMIAKELGINLQTYGLTPLNTTGDKYSTYTDDDYDYGVSYVYHSLGVSLDNTSIIQGLSTDTIVKQLARDNGPYDILYIDGGHDYATVINDIDLCTETLKEGGLMIMDDASSLLSFDKAHPGFDGHKEVGLAIRDRLDNDSTYTHLFACGHNRVWIKNK